MTSGTASSVSPKIINKVKASFEWAPTATTCELYTAYMQSKATTVTSQFNQLPTTSLSFPTAEGDPPGARPLCTSASQSFNTHAEPHFTLELQLDTDETSKLNTSTTEAQDELERRREIEQRMSKHKDNTKKKPKGFL
ncbi:hypothetical protein Pelo_11267 [Pelomyxa schiedti]|nr:hypothetical protein Pelo_11267 [Pelomyxa schiedti]